MARRNQHSHEEIRALVLSAAEMIVIEQGGAALTVRKIAMRIGYTVGSVYMVFKNMADVISHVNAQTVIELTRHLQQTPPDDLSALGRAYLAYVLQNHQRWRLWSETQISENLRACGGYQNAIAALIGFIATRLPDTGKPTQNTRLAAMLWASMQGICVALLSDQPDSAKAVEDSLDLLLARLKTEVPI